MPAKRATKKASPKKPVAAKATTRRKAKDEDPSSQTSLLPAAAKSTKAGKPAAAERAKTKPAPKRSSTKAKEIEAAVAALEQVSENLVSSWRVVATAIEELPRASDLQPLADHLYEFAVAAPKLMESIRDLPRALEPVEKAGSALEEINENLQGTQATLQDALFHMPRPSEYEPLAEPLRDFARLSPSLIEALASVPRASALLDQATRRIEESTERLATPASPEGNHTVKARLAVIRARASIESALASIPDESDYAPVASQLRELASVSPSLMAWLAEAPRLAAPLAEAVGSLRTAAKDLAEAEEALAQIAHEHAHRGF